MYIDYYLSEADGHTRNHRRCRRNNLRQPLSPTGLARFLTFGLLQHRWRGSATDKILEKRTFLWILGDRRPNLLPRPPGVWRKALVGLEGMTKGVRAGVARRAGHFANAVSRIAEQLPGLGQPNYFQELVEGHAGRLTEQGGEILIGICFFTAPPFFLALCGVAGLV